MRRRRRKKHTPDQMEQQRRGRKIFRVLGRVLLTPEIYEILAHTKPGAGGEIQLTDAMAEYARSYGGMTAVTLEENLGSFADTAQLSAYAIQAMNWAVGQGLINGSGSNLVPKAQATRAQVAAIIHRYLER